MVEGSGLLSRPPCKGSIGSNPILSANKRMMMSTNKNTLNKAYGNIPNEVGFNGDMFSWIPTWRGVKYYWIILVRKFTR